jgi:hypothetical protein
MLLVGITGAAVLGDDEDDTGGDIGERMRSLGRHCG